MGPGENIRYPRLGFPASQVCSPKIPMLRLRTVRRTNALKALIVANWETFQARKQIIRCEIMVQNIHYENKIGYQVLKKALYVNNISHIIRFISHATSHMLENSLRQSRNQRIAMNWCMRYSRACPRHSFAWEKLHSESA